MSIFLVNPKSKMLSNLREVFPSSAQLTSIFSEIPIQVPMIKLRTKQSSISFGEIIKMEKPEEESLEAEQNSFLECPQNVNNYSPYENETFGFFTYSFGTKSALSTNPNTDRSEILNMSEEQIYDQQHFKNIISKDKDTKFPKNSKNGPGNLSIEDFNILNFCGEGAFGFVYVAQHLSSGLIYALKKILKSTVSNQLDRQSLIKEIKIHIKLNHPNIIKLYDTFSTDKAIYLAMELCYSGNLYQKVKESGPFSESQVKNFVRQICNAVDYLHKKKIIHRDLKLENIVLHERQVKICDFGLACQGQNKFNEVCGTPAYMSPQMVQNKTYSNKIDIWSIGILTYELIFGKNPFQIRCQEDLNKILQQELSFPSRRPASLFCKDFIMKCLEKDPANRWDTSRLLQHAFLAKN